MKKVSVDTDGVVVTRCKDVLFVSGLVDRALRRRIEPLAREERSRQRKNDPKERAWVSPTVLLSPDSDLVQFQFTFNGEQRVLWLFFTCDCDHQDLGPASLSLSLGYWGSSEEIMRIALEALACLGPTYIDVNDSDAEEHVPTGYPSFGYEEAHRRGLVLGGPFAIERWQQQVRAGFLPVEPAVPV